MFLAEKTGVVVALETTPYTLETLVDSDYNLRIRDLSYSHEIEEYKRKYLLHTLDVSKSVMGARFGSVSFKVDLAPGATVNTEPAWSKLLQACGYKAIGWNAGASVAVASAVNGISWVPHVEKTHTPITIYVEELEEGVAPDGLRVAFSGMMGEVSFSIGTIGEPIQMNFEFQGAFANILDLPNASKLTPTGISNMVPPPVLSSTATVNGISQDFDSFEIATGNDVQLWRDPTRAGGIKGAYISARESTLNINPTSKQLASLGYFADWKDMVLRAINIGISSTPAITLSAQNAQYMSVTAGDRNGARTSEFSFLLTGTESETLGNDTFEILQGAKT